MQPPTVREIVKRLRREGWKEVRIRGDHRRFEKEGKAVTVPGNLGDTPKRGTYAAIERQAGWR